MSKWFGITIVLLLVLWLSLLSLTQLNLDAAMRKFNMIIKQHEVDLFVIKMRMQPPMIKARSKPQVAPSEPPLPRHRRKLVAGTSESRSPGIQSTALPTCW